MTSKPQKLYKTSLTRFHDSGMTNSSMRIRAVENLCSNPKTRYYNQIHCVKQPKFFNKIPKIENIKKIETQHEAKELSVSGFSNKMVKVRNLNEETEFEWMKTEGKTEKKTYKRPLTAVNKFPIYKETKNTLGMIKTSPSIIMI